jgi:hypothetical protein
MAFQKSVESTLTGIGKKRRKEPTRNVTRFSVGFRQLPYDQKFISQTQQRAHPTIHTQKKWTTQTQYNPTENRTGDELLLRVRVDGGDGRR